MKLLELAGATSRIWQIFIADSSSTTGAGLTGLVFNSGSLTCYYHRDGDTTATAVTLVTMTVGTFTSSGFKEIDATNMPGWYQLCPPNAALAAGAKSVGFHLRGATNMAPLPLEVQLGALTGVDLANVNGATGNSAAQLGELWTGTLSAIAATTITLPGGHNLDHEGNYAVILLSGTNAQGKGRYLTYSGAGEVWTVDPAWNSDGETIPNGTITAMIVAAPKLPTASIPSVNTIKLSGTAQTARDIGASVIAASVSGDVGGNVTGSVGSVVSKSGFALAATGLDPVLDASGGIEAGLSIRGMWRIMSAALFGKENGRGTGTTTFRNAVADSKVRITAVKDGSNNRATITTDQT